MKAITTLLIVTVCLTWNACTNAHSEPVATTATSTLTIPELPKRSAEYGDPTEYDHLLDAYDKAKIQLRKDPTNEKALLRIAEVFITDARITGNTGYDHDAAINILDHLINGNSKKDSKAQAYALEAVIRLSQHKFAEGKELGEKAVSLDPDRAFNYGLLVDANTELGNYPEAVKQCDKMISMRPDLRSYSRVSYQREIHGDVPGAIAAMTMAVKSGVPGTEETCWCLIQLGGIHERSGDLKSAQACYEEANAERANYAAGIAALGRVKAKQNNYADAEKDLLKATSISGQAAYYEDLARVYKANGNSSKYEAAVDSAEQAMLGLVKGTEGHNHQIGLEMARFQFEFRDQPDLALKNAEHELTHRPGNIDVNRMLAELYYAKGDMTKAAEHAKVAASTGSVNPELRCIQGLIALKNGDATGKTLLAQSLKDDPYQTGPTAFAARKAI